MQAGSERSFFVGLSISESFALGVALLPETYATLLKEHRYSMLGPLHGDITQRALLYYYKTPLIERPQLPSIFEKSIKLHLQQLEPHYRFRERLKKGESSSSSLLGRAIALSAASFHFNDLDSVMPWAIQLLSPQSKNTRELTGAVFLLSVVWGYQQSLPFEELLQRLQQWRKSSVAMQSPIPDYSWWEYEQSLWIIREVGLEPMLDFINTLNKDSDSATLTLPGETNLLSMVTYILNTAQQHAFIDGIAHMLKQGSSTVAVAAVGALIALRCGEEGVPFWMREQALHRWLFEDTWGIEKEKQWTISWEDSYKSASSNLANPKKSRSKKRSPPQNQLKLF